MGSTQLLTVMLCSMNACHFPNTAAISVYTRKHTHTHTLQASGVNSSMMMTMVPCSSGWLVFHFLLPASWSAATQGRSTDLTFMSHTFYYGHPLSLSCWYYLCDCVYVLSGGCVWHHSGRKAACVLADELIVNHQVLTAPISYPLCSAAVMNGIT